MHSPGDIQDALWAYTLGRGDDAFLHQHAVDAAAAQRADERTTPMQLTFALVGLYLYIERGYTGRQVQQLHAALARRRLSEWPAVVLPVSRGTITPADVLSAAAGPARDAAIGAWCADVWAAYRACREIIATFLRAHDVA